MSKWPTTPLGDLCDVVAGGTPARADSRYFGGDIPWVKISDMLQGVITTTEETITQSGLDNSAAKLLPVGTVLISIFATIGRTALLAIEGTTNQAIAGVNPRDPKALRADYLRRYLDYLAPALERRARGVAQSNLNSSILKSLPIPLPHISEQRRIAGILDRAEALRAKRRAALAKLDTLTQAIFAELFVTGTQSPVTIGDRLSDHPRRWRWELLTDVARLATGHTPDRKRSDYWGGDIPWITLTDIRRLDGTVAQRTTECVTEAGIDNSSAVKLPTGTVCFSRTASVGFVTVMGREMSTSQDFVNWVPGPRLNSIYLMHAFLQSRERLRSLSTGSTHKTIYFPTVEQFKVLVPPLGLQDMFAKRIAAVEQLRSAHRASLAQLDGLFASLQHRAFRGEL